MNYLIVGDVHATPQELPDCEALMSLVVDTIKAHDIGIVFFLGDQFNTHDILNTRVVDFWIRSLKKVKEAVYNDQTNQATYALVGNHDQLTPTVRSPHSMVSFGKANSVIVVDKPLSDMEFAFMPYYANPVEFIEEANKLKARCGYETLFCHQTFSGADEGKGFYSDVAVEPSAVPFKRIISGHIHKPMRLGKVWYPGSPRWRTLADVEVEQRAIWVWKEGKAPFAVPTNTHCTRIFKFEDSELNPVVINLTQDELTRADLRISIVGTPDYIAKRMKELKSNYNARCRGVPTKGRLAKASESEGIGSAFQRFAKAFIPPNGTEKELLIKETNDRLG